MAKIQKSLFNEPENHRDELRDSTSLLLVSRPDRPLTPAQREFNKLVIKVEQLRERLERETGRLDNALAYYGEHLHPRLKRLAAARKELVRKLAGFLDCDSFRRKRNRETMMAMIGDQLDEILQLEGSLDDDDLREMFERIHGIDYKLAEQQELNQVRSAMESMLEDFGIDIDFSDLRPDMTPEMVAAKAAEMAEAMRQKAEQEQPWDRQRAQRRKSKKQLQREEQMRQAEEARSKSIASIYKQLAKVLHPDLEQDDARRQQKVRLMQELTAAYHDRDLHTLLRLELEWIRREESDLDRLTEEKLAIYNQVLKDQIAELKSDIAQLPFHPRYQPIAVPDGPFDVRLKTDGPVEAHRLDRTIADVELSIAQLQTGGAIKEIHDAIREYRAMRRAADRMNDFFDSPF